MVAGNLLNAMMLYKIIKNIFNGPAFVTFDDVIGNAVHNMCSLILLRGDYFPSLTKHLEAITQRHDCFKQVGYQFATTQLRDTRAQEMHARSEYESVTCK